MKQPDWFVPEKHPLRRTWQNADAILVIFAGSAAEFALNKAVDWLYFTGKLPADPIGRLFSTVDYARRIIFAERPAAEQAIRQIVDIHHQVEAARRQPIPDWAYRDVLYMLMHYSVAAAALLHRPLTVSEKEEVYAVFLEMGRLMNIPALPISYSAWTTDYQQHLNNDLVLSVHTKDLFRQYRKHLGGFRYGLVLQTQKMVVPDKVLSLLQWRRFTPLALTVPPYRLLRRLGAVRWIEWLLVPPQYRQQVAALNLTLGHKRST